MKKKLLSLFISVAACIYCHAQGEHNVWYFGDHAGVDFNSGTPVALTGGATAQYEGCSSVSDSAGNLLFYTDGITVWNRNHVPMPNGSGLTGDYSSSQSAMIVKQPGASQTYYIFTLMSNYCYSIVDMSLNGGMGDVTAAKNVMIYSGASTEKQCATNHGNGTDVWIVMHKLGSFYAYQLTTAGFISTPVQSTVGIPDQYNYGQMKFSPRGNKIAYGIYTGSTGGPNVCVVDFDYSTGVAYGGIDIPTGSSQCYGLEFSSDGTKLYTTSHPGSQLYQYDLSAGTQAAIIASQFTLPVSGNMDTGMQLGPDGKIYVTKASANYLAVINNPNATGLACNYVYNGVSLGTGVCEIGLPELFIPRKLAVGVNEVKTDAAFSIYPNPVVSSLITITHSSLNNPADIIISSADGKEVMRYHVQEGSSSEKIEMPDLAAGVYVARLAGEGVSAKTKFVVE